MSTVQLTTDWNMCISCGICKAVCPQKCINNKEESGMNLPSIDKDLCVACGKCFKVCPGKGVDYLKNGSLEGRDFWRGSYKGIYIAKTKNSRLLHDAVSGGVATTLVKYLLEINDYKCAFLVADNSFSEHLVCTERFDDPEGLSSTQKSRYLLISHEKSIKYILSNRNEKVILIGTGCFVQGFLNVISMYGLNRDNYFIIGLFCDKTMSMNVVKYFNSFLPDNDKIKNLFFRTKDVGGWPGGVRIECESGKIMDFPNKVRMEVKGYFQPERCLYCLDKLNMFADISLGDNYVEKSDDWRGSSSVIVRTEAGNRIWECCGDLFETKILDPDCLYKSQHMEQRKDNYFFSKLKEKKIGSAINLINNLVLENKENEAQKENEYRQRLDNIYIGMKYDNEPALLKRRLRQKKLKTYIKKIANKLKN